MAKLQVVKRTLLYVGDAEWMQQTLKQSGTPRDCGGNFIAEVERNRYTVDDGQVVAQILQELIRSRAFVKDIDL